MTEKGKMPEANHIFKHKELVSLMIKAAGLHEGKWQLVVTFTFGATNIGPTPEQVLPGAFAAVQSIGLQRADPTSPEVLVVDASEVNPR